MNEIIAHKADENHHNILGLKTRIGEELLMLGALLVIQHDNKYYKYYSDTWEEYLAMPEIGMSRFFAHKLMQINRVWIDKFNVSLAKLNIDSEKLYLTSRKANENNYEELLEYARTNSRSDVIKMFGKEYEFDPERYKVVICPKCGYEFKQVI